MRHYIILFLLLFHYHTLQAQNENVCISIAMPSNINLDTNTQLILKNKIIKLISIQGITGTEFGSIIITPDVNIINSSVINSGMRRIISIELVLSLTLRNIITNTVFDVIHISVIGEGYSEDEAKRSAINKIDVSTLEYTQFIKTAKIKIADYYNTNTIAIIGKANVLASQQLFDEALALLTSYPESLNGSSKVSNAMMSIFKDSQVQYCNQILLSAKAAYSQHNYIEATELIKMIDAQSNCATEAKTLLNAIKKDIDLQYKDSIIMEKENKQLIERINTIQIQAIRDVATAYFKRQTEYIFF